MKKILLCLSLLCIHSYGQVKVDIYNEKTINTMLNIDHISSPNSMKYMNALIAECLNSRNDAKLNEFISDIDSKINYTLWRDYTKIAMNDPDQQKTNDFRKNNFTAISQLEGILNFLAAARLAGQTAAIKFEKTLQEKSNQSNDLAIKAYEDWWNFYLDGIYRNVFYGIYVDFIAQKYQHNIRLENASQILHLLKQFKNNYKFPDDNLMILMLWTRKFNGYSELSEKISNEIIKEIEDNYLNYGYSLNEYHQKFLEVSTVILCKIASKERVEIFRKEMARVAKEKQIFSVEYMISRNWDNLIKLY